MPNMPNIDVEADYFLPIISDCTSTDGKKSIPPFTYSELLLLLLIVTINRRKRITEGTW